MKEFDCENPFNGGYADLLKTKNGTSHHQHLQKHVNTVKNRQTGDFVEPKSKTTSHAKKNPMKQKPPKLKMHVDIDKGVSIINNVNVSRQIESNGFIHGLACEQPMF